jgi:hypothetical protein
MPDVKHMFRRFDTWRSSWPGCSLIPCLISRVHRLGALKRRTNADSALVQPGGTAYCGKIPILRAPAANYSSILYDAQIRNHESLNRSDTGCLSEAAYYIESDGEAAIIDPLRETAALSAQSREQRGPDPLYFRNPLSRRFCIGPL